MVINPSMFTHFYSCQSSVQKTPCGAAPTLPSSAPCSPPTVTVSGDPGMMGLKQRVNLDTERRVNDWEPDVVHFFYEATPAVCSSVRIYVRTYI